LGRFRFRTVTCEKESEDLEAHQRVTLCHTTYNALSSTASHVMFLRWHDAFSPLEGLGEGEEAGAGEGAGEGAGGEGGEGAEEGEGGGEGEGEGEGADRIPVATV